MRHNCRDSLSDSIRYHMPLKQDLLRLDGNSELTMMLLHTVLPSAFPTVLKLIGCGDQNRILVGRSLQVVEIYAHVRLGACRAGQAPTR
jgi:hypothetical protein